MMTETVDLRAGDITELIDFSKTFGKLIFSARLKDIVERFEDGETGEATTIRISVVSEKQGADFNVLFDPIEHPHILLSLIHI